MILMFASALAASDSAETPTLTLDITLDAGVVFDCSLTGLSGTILNGAGQNDTYTLPPALSWRQAPFDQNDTHTVFDGSDWLVGIDVLVQCSFPDGTGGVDVTAVDTALVTGYTAFFDLAHSGTPNPSPSNPDLTSAVSVFQETNQATGPLFNSGQIAQIGYRVAQTAPAGQTGTLQFTFTTL